MKWGIAAAVASAAAVAAASGAELLACDCADQPQQEASAASVVGRCDAFVVRHNKSSSSSRADRAGEHDQVKEGKKFAPRFDGLRFIETLVTAHR
uniref:Secreted protein n=1 Tax=Leersia perrieri TaxID=77586 RepID=A0A0D9XHY4_9ORYZ